MNERRNKKIDTLLIEKDLLYNDKWSPALVSDYEIVIKSGVLSNIDSAVLKNICYSLQYLEFIDLQIKSLKLHSVIEKMLYKTYIITSISIIEAVFYSILKINNELPFNTEKKIFSTKSNQKKMDNKYVILETNIYEIIDPIEKEITFDSMIQKIEKGSYLDLKDNFFPYIKYFKQLRNRVHIHITQGNNMDTDFWKFSRLDYLFIKYILLKILIDKKMENYDIVDGVAYVPDVFNNLIISSEEKEEIKDYYKNKIKD